MPEAIVVGSGPNGLGAAIVLARAGLAVRVLEGEDTVGGGCRSAELTLPGFVHDVCSAIHPLAVASPFLRTVPLAEHGVEWVESPAALAHPFDDGTRGAARTARSRRPASTLGVDGARYRRLMAPLVERAGRAPRGPARAARGAGASAAAFARLLGARRRCRRARSRARVSGASGRAALFAGLAAHSMVPLTRLPTASYGLVLGVLAPRAPAGRSRAAARSGSPTGSSRTSARSAARSRPGGAWLARRARRRAAGAARRDAARSSSRWRADGCRRATGAGSSGSATGPACSSSTGRSTGRSRGARPSARRRRRCTWAGRSRRSSPRSASRGGAASPSGRSCCSPSRACSTRSRAPEGKHTAWAYCHVPNGSTVDMTERIEAQVERFAPGFRELILARSAMGPAAMEAHNPNYVGGDINGGAADLRQTVGARRRTRRRSPACSSARPRRRRAAASTACAASTPRRPRSALAPTGGERRARTATCVGGRAVGGPAAHQRHHPVSTPCCPRCPWR